jgi:hypothetical protein
MTHHVAKELSLRELPLLLLQVDLILQGAQLVHCSLRVKLLLLRFVLQTIQDAIFNLRRIDVSVACPCNDLEC